MEDAFIRKKQPYNLDAEQSVIGSMIMDRDAIVDVSDILTKEDFYSAQNAILYENMIELFKEGMAVDLITLNNRLREKNIPEDVAGMSYIADIIAAVPTSANAKYYAKIVADKAVLRRMIKMCEDVEKDCYLDTDDVDGLLETAESGIYKIVQQRNGANDFASIDSIVLDVIDQIEAASRQNTRVTGVPTGFIDLDNMLTGLHGSELILVAARPAMGKTAFVLNIAHHVAVKKRIPVAIFSLEMSKEQLVTRMIALDSLVNSQKIQTGQLVDDEWDKIMESTEVIADAPIFVDDNSAITVADLRSKCRKLKQNNDLGLIIIDYLQLMTAGADMRGNREQEVSMISRQLKIIAKELNIPVIALSQLNRGVEQRTGDAKKPMLSDLRESGAIEQDADMVLFIHRPERYGIMEDSMGNSLKGIADIIIAKHRNGAVGEIQLRFRNELAQFCDLEEVSPFASGGSTVKTVTFGSRMNEDAAPQMPQLDSDFQEGGKSFENPANSSKAPF